MIDRSENECREHLSALVDGDLDVGTTKQVCARWRDDPAVRAAWHTYHLIGDVLRSEELAGDAVRSQVLLHQLRQRLSSQPEVMATRRQSALTETFWAWMVPAGVAVGFMAVSSAMFLATREPDATSTVATLAVPEAGGRTAMGLAASASTPALVPGPDAAAMALTDSQVVVANGKLVRDLRLEHYLSAHQQFVGASSFSATAGFLRSATIQASERWTTPAARP